MGIRPSSTNMIKFHSDPESKNLSCSKNLSHSLVRSTPFCARVVCEQNLSRANPIPDKTRFPHSYLWFCGNIQGRGYYLLNRRTNFNVIRHVHYNTKYHQVISVVLTTLSSFYKHVNEFLGCKLLKFLPFLVYKLLIFFHFQSTNA